MSHQELHKEGLGGLLRRYRLAAGLSQEELAEKAGVHRTYVSQVEGGGRNPTFETLMKFLTASGVSWTDFGAALDGLSDPTEDAGEETEPSPKPPRPLKERTNEDPVGSSTRETNDMPSGQGSSGKSPGQRVLSVYLKDLATIRASGAGVPETSYYPAIAELLNGVGKTLKPRVRCIMNLRNLGAGLPDGGLFTAEQLASQADGQPQTGQLPSRGAIEAKGTRPDLRDIARSAQVIGDNAKPGYLSTYGIVLVTNLRGFLIVERGPDGQPTERESFELAESEADFWSAVSNRADSTAVELGDQFYEFLSRACLHAAPLSGPGPVAWFLASYARDALKRIERKKELPALQSVRLALEGALGMHFSGVKGEHFFRSTLVQTLFYGVFSAWVRWHKDGGGGGGRFDWRTAEWSLHVPFVRSLYEEVAKPSSLKPLGLVEVLDWAAAVLGRVDLNEFFKAFREDHAVQYFYEPFLEAFDPELRKELGVWYTPEEVVKYQVGRVDQVLRNELGVVDGLADPSVVVLDPCCGTGAYLVEVIHTIAATLRSKGGDALIGSDLREAAANRVFGFEIMPAPFVVAHLQLGLTLRSYGADLSKDRGDRVGVYLTNALTGWDPPSGAKQEMLTLGDLLEERDAAGHIKRDANILVVLGNPPYNAFAGVSPEEEHGLVEPYKIGLNTPREDGGWGIRKFNLDELYIRFYRLAERRIADMTGTGVVSFISNYSYLSDPSFVVMRQRFLAEFDALWFDCMNGDSRETGKLTPNGDPDPSVFSTERNRQGIRLGTAISVLVRRRGEERRSPVVRYRDFWGTAKREQLLASLNEADFDDQFELAGPNEANRLSFRPECVSDAYNSWPSVVAFCAHSPISGLQEMRRGALMDFDPGALAERMRVYFDTSVDWSSFVNLGLGLEQNGGRFNAKDARARLCSTEGFEEGNLRRYALFPFDNRWAYHTNTRPLWNEPRPDVALQSWAGNRFFVTRTFSERPNEWAVMTVTSALPDYHLLRPNAVAIPIRVKGDAGGVPGGQGTLFVPTEERANLSDRARQYLAAIGVEGEDEDPRIASLLWMHALAIGYSALYLTENADGLKRDWARVPVPARSEALLSSAALGEELAALLDVEAEVPGVTVGAIPSFLQSIGPVSRVGGGQLDPAGEGLWVTAGWGHPTKTGAIMPGKGLFTEREWSESEAAAVADAADSIGVPNGTVAGLLGLRALDVYLNEDAYWRNIPRAVWEFRIGGYQVLKKWLSYRDEKALGRSLKRHEVREFTGIARRIAALLLRQPALDKNYQAVKADAYSWDAN